MLNANLKALMNSEANLRNSEVKITFCLNGTYEKVSEAELPEVQAYAQNLGMQLVFFAKSPYGVLDNPEVKKTRCDSLEQAVELFRHAYGTSSVPCVNMLMNRIKPVQEAQ